MAKPKKQSREERLRKKRLAERRRYERIKNNDDLWKEKQEKNRKNYLRRKAEKKQLQISEMNPGQQRLQRRRWRKNYKTYYLRKKQEKRTAALLAQNTPPLSPSILSDTETVPIQGNTPDLSPLENPFINEIPTSSVAEPTRTLRSMSEQNNDLSEQRINTPNTKLASCPSPISSAVRCIRYKEDKEINNLKQIIINIKRQSERYRKQLQRIKMTEIKENLKTLDMLQQNKIIPKIKRVARNSNAAPNLNLKALPDILKKRVEIFYDDDENNRICSGKKEFVVRNKIRKQKRYLSDSLRNLHKK